MSNYLFLKDASNAVYLLFTRFKYCVKNDMIGHALDIDVCELFNMIEELIDSEDEDNLELARNIMSEFNINNHIKNDYEKVF